MEKSFKKPSVFVDSYRTCITHHILGESVSNPSVLSIRHQLVFQLQQATLGMGKIQWNPARSDFDDDFYSGPYL